MARIRSIKPEFPQSESMGRISREARLTFILLWTLVDDSGRTRDSSRFLASMLYPYDDDAPKLISGWLDELEGEGCITRYAIAHGTSKNNPHADPTDHYLQINKWLIHQKIDRPSPSKIPPFDEGSASTRRILDEPSSADLDMDLDLDLERKGSGGDARGGFAAKEAKPHSRRTLPAAPPKGTPGLKKNELPQGLNRDAFAEWDRVRRERGGKSKASWTPKAKEKCAELLAQHTASEQQAMVDASIAAGYQGLFPTTKGNGAKTFKQIDADDEEARMKPIRDGFIKRHSAKPVIDGEAVKDE